MSFRSSATWRPWFLLLFEYLKTQHGLLFLYLLKQCDLLKDSEEVFAIVEIIKVQIIWDNTILQRCSMNTQLKYSSKLFETIESY